MAHYFTREEAEALLPQVSVVLRKIQECRLQMRRTREEIEALRMQAMGNGHHLHEPIMKLQQRFASHVDILSILVDKLATFGCELKDPDTGLIDFLSLRDGQEVYLCWRLGEVGIRFWHYLDTGLAGRQSL